MRAVRLILLGGGIAAGWLALSLTVSAPPAQAATTPAGWIQGDEDARDRGSLGGILSGLNEAVDRVTETATATVERAVEPAVTHAVAPVGAAVATAAAGVVSIADDVAAGTVETVSGAVADVVSDAGPLTDAVAELTSITGVTGDRSLPSLTRSHGIPEPLASAVAELTAALWPLHDSPAPWSPREVILLSAGVLTAGAPGGAGPLACDLAFVERWFALALGLSGLDAHERAPSPPTFDTDCTPD